MHDQRVTKVKKCFLCFNEAQQLRRFPPLSRPQEQLEWILRQNHDHTVTEELLDRHRRVKEARWCQRHFNSSDDVLPIDHRSDPTRSLTMTTVPLRTTRPADLVPPFNYQLPIPSSQSGMIISGGPGFHSVPPSPSFLAPTIEPLSSSAWMNSSYDDHNDDWNDIAQVLPKRFKKSVSTKTTATLESESTEYHCSQENSQDESEDEIVEDEEENGQDLGRYSIVEECSLWRLLKRCQECGSVLDKSLVTMRRCGSARIVTYDCLQKGCNGMKWESQAKVGTGKGRVFSANHSIPIGSFITGTPIPRLCEFAKLLGIEMPSDRIMRKTIREIGSVSIDRVYKEWEETVRNIAVNASVGQGLQVSIDAQYDSPGYTASNCKISIIDCDTRFALAGVAKNKDETGIEGISCRMESEGTCEALMELLSQNIPIKRRVGDQNHMVNKKLREEPTTAQIEMALDWWHILKPMRREWWTAVKAKPELTPIYRMFFNHLYHVHLKYSKIEDRARALEVVQSFVLHIQGIHKWKANADFKTVFKCEHGRLKSKNNGEKRITLEANSEELEMVRGMVFKKSFMKAFLSASSSIDTAINESYHSLSLLYAPKRFSCSPFYYALKMRISMLHYNSLMMDDFLERRSEIGSTVLSKKGRVIVAVKRKRGPGTHTWRDEVLKESVKGREELCTSRVMARLGIPDDDLFDEMNTWWEDKEQKWGLESEAEEESQGEWGESEEGEEGDGDDFDAL